MLVETRYKAEMYKRIAALLKYWLLQHIHNFKGGADSVCECFNVAM